MRRIATFARQAGAGVWSCFTAVVFNGSRVVCVDEEAHARREKRQSHEVHEDGGIYQQEREAAAQRFEAVAQRGQLLEQRRRWLPKTRLWRCFVQ